MEEVIHFGNEGIGIHTVSEDERAVVHIDYGAGQEYLVTDKYVYEKDKTGVKDCYQRLKITPISCVQGVHISYKEARSNIGLILLGILFLIFIIGIIFLVLGAKKPARCILEIVLPQPLEIEVGKDIEKLQKAQAAILQAAKHI